MECFPYKVIAHIRIFQIYRILLHDFKRQHVQGGLQGQRQMKLKAIGANFGGGESGVCQADPGDAVLDRATDLL
jgi:hypothetical protein